MHRGGTDPLLKYINNNPHDNGRLSLGRGSFEALDLAAARDHGRLFLLLLLLRGGRGRGGLVGGRDVLNIR